MPTNSSDSPPGLAHKPRRWVSVADAAEHIGVTPNTIRAMIADGRLSGYRAGKRLTRLDLNEVDAAMQPFRGGPA
ncbi:helix-turn-helix domain-containing protein [Mycobacterium sp. UM_Kg1]|uniref:helix-turn-helix domain-containing protein n=1 Tax=Mycobacterium sp. UM_Kg1 TaxID=1545691 RepID=UPI00061AC243|nr:helix-turn-helix domain-containing protein [Mycobacterium sp. UM_Kg1]